jgi:solute carrier family 25 iron transporter 28/37
MLPLDNIKTHCQAGSKFRLTEIIKNIYETGGLKNFYSGSSILAMGCIPAHAIYFSIYEKAKEILNCEDDENSYRFALVGVLASLFHDSIMTPT